MDKQRGATPAVPVKFFSDVVWDKQRGAAFAAPVMFFSGVLDKRRRRAPPPLKSISYFTALSDGNLWRSILSKPALLKSDEPNPQRNPEGLRPDALPKEKLPNGDGRLFRKIYEMEILAFTRRRAVPRKGSESRRLSQ